MTALGNHPHLWLRDDAARAFNRLEAAHGRFTVTSAGRTVAEQQRLIDRWWQGGTYNRPPYLYEPARPPETSAHVRDGGVAVDIQEWQRFKEVAGAFGFVQTFVWDVVHFEYVGTGDEVMVAEDDIRWLMKQLGGSNSRTTSLRQDMDNLMDDVQWLKDQVGGSNSRSTSLRQDVDKLLKDK